MYYVFTQTYKCTYTYIDRRKSIIIAMATGKTKLIIYLLYVYMLKNRLTIEGCTCTWCCDNPTVVVSISVSRAMLAHLHH